jgi:hypothetical protein
MLPPTYKTPEKPKYDALPVDIYQVVIEDINIVEKPKFKKPEENETQLSFTFLVLDEGFEGRRIWKDIRPVMSSGSDKGQASWLYKLFVAVHKAEPEDVQMYGLTSDELNAFIGKQMRLNIGQTPAKEDGTVYNKIEAMLPSKKDLPVPDLKTKRPETIRDLPPAYKVKDEDIPVIDTKAEDLPF